MTANVNVTKLLVKRGNTAQNAAYTGINGEITVDTQAKTLRVHDGVTTGGNIVTAGAMASYIPTDPTITSIQANVAAANAAISAITGIDTSLLANAATQQTQIDVLNANVDTINANIGAFQTYANATATTVANLTNGASTVSLSTDGNLTLPGGGLLGQVYGDGIDTELTIKSPPGVGDSGYVALASANEQNYVEVNNTSIVLGVDFGQAGFKTWTFGTDGVLTAPGNIVLLNGAVIKDTVGGAVAFGVNAGLNSQGIEAIAIGLGAGSDTQGNNTIAIGEAAGNNTQGIEAVAIGRGAGATTQGSRAVAISIGAGGTGQGEDAIAIGYNAGTTGQTEAAVAIGRLAGQTSQGQYSVAIGDLSGANTQGNNSVAIGTTAGETSQGDRAVAIGLEAGTTSQGVGGVAIGEQAGHTSQGVLSVAIGYYAGSNAQSFSAVAIGAQAGETAQGQHAVAIGDLAGQTAQGNKSIILNATGVALNQTTANTFTVAPVRNDVVNVDEVMFYNTTSKEITYGNTISIAGNIGANQYNFANGVNILSAVAGTYGNASVASYLLQFDGDIEFTSSVARIGNVDVITVLDSIQSPAYRFSNGASIFDGITGTYSNTNVAAYLTTGVTTANLTTTGNVVQQSAYYETYSNVANSGGNLICNFVNGATFYATLTANVTVNFTNVVATAGQVTGATLIVDQGVTPYGVANIQINSGGVQTIKYAGGTPNTGTASNTDIMSFSLISLDGTAWRVLGQISNYG